MFLFHCSQHSDSFVISLIESFIVFLLEGTKEFSRKYNFNKSFERVIVPFAIPLTRTVASL